MEKSIPLWPVSGRVDAPWIPSPKKAILYALNLARVQEGSYFADIGCGDGRAAIMASKYAKSISTCIEVREELCALSQANAEYNGVADRFNVICSDARNIEYNHFDVVYIYMFPSFIAEISKKLDEELKVGSKIVTLDFPIVGWIPILMKKFMDEGGIERALFLYLIGISNPSSWRLADFNGYPKF
ncbi:MAG: methyltransferase domain-containing protein [Fervidicoccaceae archaeon]